MKKLLFLLGAGLGFLLGSKAGREPYAQVERRVRELANRPEVHDAVEKAKSAAHDQANQISDKMPFGDSRGSDSGAHPQTSAFEHTRA